MYLLEQFFVLRIWKVYSNIVFMDAQILLVKRLLIVHITKEAAYTFSIPFQTINENTNTKFVLN